MALPNQLKSARLTDSSPGNTIDNELGNAEKAICDILGMPVDTNISAALLEIVAAGLKSIILQDAAADPGSVGVIRRNGTALKFHNGAAVKTIVFTSDIAAPSNAAGVRTISTSAPSGTPADGDTWERY